MWGTVVLDAYANSERRDMFRALEATFGPASGTSWATAGIYVYWDFETRDVLYVGLAGDLPVRFAQHNRLRGCPASGCKKQQIDAYFTEREKLGFSVIPLSHLSQPTTARWARHLDLNERELIDVQEALSEEAFDVIRALEGRLIDSFKLANSSLPPWNKDPGRVPRTQHAGDGVLAASAGQFDCLLQARRTIRELGVPSAAAIYEEHLHGPRMLAVAAAMSGRGFRNDILRRILSATFPFEPTPQILATGYLDQRNPLTVGPVLDPPAS